MPDQPTPIPAAPDTGAKLRHHIKARRIHQNALARLSGIHRDTLHDLKKRPTLQTATLWSISHVLRHNFFDSFAAALPPDFSTDVPPDTTKDDRIAALEKSLEMMTAERDLLLSIVKAR